MKSGIKMSQRDDENDDAISILLGREDLTEWENTFLENIQDKDSLTPTQQEKLDEIWARKMEM